jgi:hypothetical protein
MVGFPPSLRAKAPPAVLCRENVGGKIPRISLKIYSFSAGLSRKTAIFPEKKIRRSRRLFLV